MAHHAPLLASDASLPEAIRLTRFRSKLELNFALQMEARKIRWFYEPERICRYLIDFYVPTGKLWVEVKGKVTTRDYLLLREAAVELHTQRRQRLYMWTSRQAYQVGMTDFVPLSHEQFWQLFSTDSAVSAEPTPATDSNR